MSAGFETSTAMATGAKPRLGEPTWPRAFRGLWLLTWKSQLTVKRLLLLALTVSAVPLLTYLTVDPGRTKPFLHWLIKFYFQSLVPIYCLSVCGSMIREELQGDTFSFLVTRPWSRARFFLIKYACQILWLQMLGVINLGLFWLVGASRQISDIKSVFLILAGTQILAIIAYGALSALLGLIHQRYMVLGILYGFVVELGIGWIPTNINNLSLSRHFRTFLAHSDSIGLLYGWSMAKTGLSIFIVIVASLVFLAAGALLFTFREYHHTEEMQR